MTQLEIRLFDHQDAPWIRALLDVVERCIGEPWRVMLERVEHAPLRVHVASVKSIVGALRRFAGSRAERARVARKARSLVLGAPALDRDARDARLAAAGAQLGLPPAEVEAMLWGDLAMERPVALPMGRPRELALAALANLDRIQRAVRRAREVRIRVPDSAHDLVRTVQRRGLIAAISRDGDATVLDITGPLALFHATTVYGGALAGLVPLLVEHESFTLDIQHEIDGGLQTLHVEPPVLLPALPPSRRRTPTVAELLARDLVEHGFEVVRDPEPIACGEALAFPDVEVTANGQRWLVEVIGWATREYLDYKLACYRDAGIERIVLCVDGTRAHLTKTRTFVPYVRRVEIATLAEIFGA